MIRRFAPDTVAGRTLLVLFVGLTVSNGLSLGLYLVDRTAALDSVGGAHIAERVITVARVLEKAPPAMRERLVDLAGHPAVHMTWNETSTVARGAGPGWNAGVLQRAFAAHVHQMEDERELRLRTATAADVKPENWPAAGSPGEILQGSLQLADGSWLNFWAAVEPAESIWSTGFIFTMVFMVISVVLMSIFVVHHLNRPLRIFASAARRLGRDMRAPALEEFGPREVREATQAFNEMQGRIRRLLDDRAHMLYAISHDLRTPITLLRLRAEFVSEEDERAKILATLGDMESMVESILAFARDDPEKEPMRTVDIAALVSSICDDMTDAGLTVDYSGPERLNYECRASSIKRALTNIIDNAIKYGGVAHVCLEDDAEAITVVVDDEGPGIPAVQLDLVFTPFYRVEESRNAETGGTGLGLAVARTSIVAHGGRVVLENRPEGGLRATVRLPR